MDVGNYTLREVAAMVYFKKRDMWTMVSSLAATVMNASGNYKERVDPNKINPYRQEEDKSVGSDIPLDKQSVVKLLSGRG